MNLFRRLFHPVAPDYKRLCEKALNDLRVKTSAHQSVWGLGRCDRWDLDQEDGRLRFTFPDLIVECDAQIIGSWDSVSTTWRWAWSNASVAEALRVMSTKIRDYGCQHHIRELTDEKWKASEADAWRVAALACVLCDAQGIYRGPAGGTFVFIAFGSQDIRKK